jgi:hypothetical protein
MLYVEDVEPLRGYWLRLTLTDGQVIERDVSEALWGPVFEPVRDRRVFEAARVDGGTVTWPGGADLAPETLIWGGRPPADSSARPQKRLRLPPTAPSATR